MRLTSAAPKPSKSASRDLVESFISHLSSSAKEDRDGLICKLNSYSHPVEVKQ